MVGPDFLCVFSCTCKLFLRYFNGYVCHLISINIKFLMSDIIDIKENEQNYTLKEDCFNMTLTTHEL